MRDRILLAGILAGLLGVALGAFGAHGLKARVSESDLATFETGVRYQMYHALALLALGLASAENANPWVGRAAWAFGAGIVVFSGTLYLLVLTGARWWGAITPFGGVAFLAGWLAFAAAVLHRVRS